MGGQKEAIPLSPSNSISRRQAPNASFSPFIEVNADILGQRQLWDAVQQEYFYNK